MKISLFLLLLPTTAIGAPVSGPALDPGFGRVIQQCKNPDPSKPDVWVFKHWDLALADDSQADAGARRPQTQSQASIFRQLDEWVYAQSPGTLVTAGCDPAEIKSGFAQRLHGWTLAEVEKKTSDPGFDDLPAPIAFKLEAKHGSIVRTFCADSREAERLHAVALSSARAALGFYTRLADPKEKQAVQLEYRLRALELYQLPPSTPGRVLLRTLNRKLKESLAEMNRQAKQRTELLLSAVRQRSGDSRRMMVLAPGAFAKNLAHRLQESRFACKVIEPKGYLSETEVFLSEIDRWLRGEVD